MPRTLNLCFTMIKPQPSSDPHLPPKHTPGISNSIYGYSPVSDHHSASDSESKIIPTPDFATAYASERFFFSSPGHSNSIIDSPPLDQSTVEIDSITDGSIAVSTYSTDPFKDFRRSMHEMAEARKLHDVREDWDYLCELLMCYLSMNPKSTHKFIIAAFTDLLVNLMAPATEKSHQNKPLSDATSEILRLRDMES